MTAEDAAKDEDILALPLGWMSKPLVHALRTSPRAWGVLSGIAYGIARGDRNGDWLIDHPSTPVTAKRRTDGRIGFTLYPQVRPGTLGPDKLLKNKLSVYDIGELPETVRETMAGRRLGDAIRAERLRFLEDVAIRRTERIDGGVKFVLTLPSVELTMDDLAAMRTVYDPAWPG